MASSIRNKTAIRLALYSYITGLHHITETAGRLFAQHDHKKKTETERFELINGNYQNTLKSEEAFHAFLDTLDEEDMYPFGTLWPRDEMWALLSKLIPPVLTADEGEEIEIRFKKGFKELLTNVASEIETDVRPTSHLDHWLVALINLSFHSAINIAARFGENSKTYHDAIEEIELEEEPWTRYRQITDALDRQLARETKRKTGLVIDTDYDM